MILPLPKLQKAICLGRSDDMTIDVAVQDGPVQKLHCPIDQSLPGCTSLGSRIWFSTAHQKDNAGVWELVEVDGGFLTCVNPTRIHDVFINGLENGLITALQDYPKIEPLEEGPFDVKVWDEKKQKSIMVAILPVMLGDEIHRGFFPHDKSPHYAHVLREMIKAKYKGQEVMGILAVANNGIRRVFLADHIDPQVSALLRDCIDLDIEIYAHQIMSTLECIELGQPMPFKVLSS